MHFPSWTPPLIGECPWAQPVSLKLPNVSEASRSAPAWSTHRPDCARRLSSRLRRLDARGSFLYLTFGRLHVPSLAQTNTMTVQWWPAHQRMRICAHTRPRPGPKRINPSSGSTPSSQSIARPPRASTRWHFGRCLFMHPIYKALLNPLTCVTSNTAESAPEYAHTAPSSLPNGKTLYVPPLH